MLGSLRHRAGWICAFVVCIASSVSAGPDVADKFSIGAGGGTDHKPQSKLWFNDGTWWGIVCDGTGQHIWKFDGGAFVREPYADAVVDSRTTARADVLWDGTYLYVLSWHDALPKFSKYSYDSSTQTYHRLAGFPVDLAIPGAEVIVFDKDTTGRLWASFELHNEIHAIWTTTPDHLSWNTTGTVLETQVGSDDISTTVAFGTNIGVLWSDQGSDASWRFGFRYHRDADPPETWAGLEVVDTGSMVDDHINIKADASGRLYFAGKDLYNNVNLYVRETSTGWRRAATNINNGNCTRPCVEIDEAQNTVHVFYTDWLESPNPIKMVTAPLATLSFGTPEIWLVPAGLSLNNVTGTKQRLSARTGIMAMASSSSSAYWGFENLDTDTPTVTGIDPVDDQVGVPVQPLLQLRLTDAGMGIRRSSISMTLDGAPVTPSTVGSALEYLLTYTPPVPLQNGRIYTLAVSAQDYAYPPHTASTSLRFRTEMLPVELQKKIDFQPASAPTASGYEPDWGSAYSLDRGIGWDKSMTLKRANASSDLRLDTYVERKNSSSKATWSYDVANGTYRITFASGAADATGKQRVEVEGEVLINNQSTTVGQFITIADYPIVVQDGQLDVRIGGASGSSSSKTQLCFFEFEYDGPAPPPPPPGDQPAPRAVQGVTVARVANDLRLAWTTVTEDTLGALIAVTHYHVYRSTTPGFTPDRNNHTNRVGVVSSPTFTDFGAATAATDLYYLVTAERASGEESTVASNLGLRRKISLVPAPGTTRSTWLALPYQNAYGTASGLVASMNSGAGGTPVVAVARVERNTQVKQTWRDANGSWSGTDFALLPGEAVEVTAAATLDWSMVGSENGAPTYGFAFHTAVGNLSWVSLPQNASYTDARSLVQSLNAGTGGAPITRIAWLDPATGQMESWVYFAGAWRGTNFTFRPGNGLAVLAGGDLPLWKPRVLPN